MISLNIKAKHGFSLVEMAVVLVILGLILSSFLLPLSTQIDQAKTTDARKELAEAREALLGYVAIHGFLPCPDTTDDGIADACIAPASSSTTSSFGNLPWADLGLQSTDPWGQHYQYRVNNAFTVPFTIAENGTGAGVNRICTDNTCTATEAANVPLVVYSLGKNGATTPPVGLDEQENVDGDGNFVSHGFTTGANTFDDMVVWISTSVIMNRMITIGKLP